MERNVYVEKYLNAYKEMKAVAIEKMKNYGNELDVWEVCKKRFLEMSEYDEINEDNIDDLEEFSQNESYCCLFKGKHEFIYLVRIKKVRYDHEKKRIEVFVESDEGDVSEWLPESWISYDSDAVWMTILDFCE